jgi:predicted nucleic acid-binding protein
MYTLGGNEPVYYTSYMRDTTIHTVSLFDAIYMELAIRYSTALATADKKSRIAKSAGIDIVKI